MTGIGSPTDAASEARDPDPVEGSDILKAGRWGRYEVLGRLGAGSMGIVFEARDPALRRRVALKILQPRRNRSADDAARRLAVEAQAMARLAHPNVVAVYEIDRVGDQVYVAMELVAGTTLRGWLQGRSRTWREIVETFVAAGRGLAAAHAAGLVHRDFKPDNVLIGSDGRARVSDFGMAAAAAGDGESERAEPAEISDATPRGSAVGTPAYASPEQLDGRPVDARSDQFAFCAALWEALFGHPPGPGGGDPELRAGDSGDVAEPVRGRRVPRWLLAMLRRGLAADPAARWPDIDTLLDAVERRGRAGRRSIIAAGAAGVAIAAAVAGVAVVGSRGAPDACALPTDRLAAVWGPARGAALRTHLVVVDPVHGRARYAAIAATLDAGARAWGDMHVAACRATRVEGIQSDTLLDRRMECLDRWLVELGDTVDVIAQASNPAAVDHSAHAASSLSPVELCADTRALAAAPPPASAADRPMAIELANRTRELDVAQRAGQLDGLLPKVVDSVSAARVLGHEPTLAGALVVQVRVLNRLNDRGASEALLRELVQVAASANDDRDEAFAWTNLLVVIGQANGKTDEALALVPSARAAVLRAGNPIDLRADLLYHQGIVYDFGYRPAEGRKLLEEARQLLERAGAASPTSPLANRLGDVLHETGHSYLKSEDPERSAAVHREMIERWRAVSGVDSVDEAYEWDSMSLALQRAGKADEALSAIHEAVRIREARLGESVALAFSLVVYACALYEAGRFDESITVFDRAIPMARATMTSGDVNFGDAVTNRGVVLARVRRFDEALRDYNEAIAIYEQVGTDTVGLGVVLINRGDLAAQRGRCAEAYGDYARATEMLDKLAGATSHLLIYALNGHGACLVRSGRPAEAIPLLERSLRCKANGADAFEVARAKVYLGRARVESRRDVAGGIAMVRAARPAIAAVPEGADELATLDRWLAAHAR